MDYIIGTGWWCDGSGKHASSVNNNSTDLTRHQKFSLIWSHFIKKYSNPQRIIVVDSNSPEPFEAIIDYDFIRMTRNFGHAINCDTHLCGWTRSLLISAFYAFMNDMHYVYIEQDVLIHGENIIERAIENLHDADFSHGTWEHNYKVEQSFVVIKWGAILRFIGAYMSFGQSDKEMRPELKFHQMGDSHLSSHGNLRFKELPFGYGRRRPIDFDDNHFYAQHWTDEELRNMLGREGLTITDFIQTKPREKY